MTCTSCGIGYGLLPLGLFSTSSCKSIRCCQYICQCLMIARAMSFTYSFPAIIRRVPSIAIPYYDTPDSKGIYICIFMTDFHFNIANFLLEALFRSECAKYVIILDCGNLTRDESNAKKRISLRPEEIEACYLRLTHWWNSRSPEIHPDHAPTRENLLCA